MAAGLMAGRQLELKEDFIMDKITIKNISTATVVISAPEIKFRRELIPGRTITITQEEYEDLMFEPGVQNLILTGYIKIDGVPEEQQTMEMPVTVDADEIKKILLDKDVTKFAQFMPTASVAAKDAVVQFAVDLGITDNAFVALIKKYCNVDIIDAISRKHQLED